MAAITKRYFDTLPDGREVELYRLENSRGAYVNILTYGGIIHSACVPDKNGALCDVVLGFDSLAPYLDTDLTGYMGALIGRHAGRIRNGVFTLNGRTYRLTKNDHGHQLHGGPVGLHNKVWRASVLDGMLILDTSACHLEENYPGNLTVRVVYGFSDAGELSLEYFAASDEDTVVNLTNHCYFNLDGQGTGLVADNLLKINARLFAPCDADCLTDGTLAEVAGTPFDFLDYHPIGERADADDPQLRNAGGYDHCYVFTEGTRREFGEIARAYSEKTGISMRVLTDSPAVQFYGGNFLTAGIVGKGGVPYDRRSGFCLETQFIPNSLEYESYPHPILRAGEGFHYKTVFQFGNEK